MDSLSTRPQDEAPGTSPSQVKREDSSPHHEGSRGSPPPNCAICLGTCRNKSFTDSCLHQFCFRCLLTWSKVKAVCPLCKQTFRSIIHNVRSNHQYEEYMVEQRHTEEISDIIGIDTLSSATRRFRYRTTLTLPRQESIAIEQLLLHHYPMVADILPSPTPRRRSPTSFRRTVYRYNLWARPLPDFTGRFRDCTPVFYRYNTSQMHRLVPWLHRELQYLLNENVGHIAYVVARILELLPQESINSVQFRDAMIRFFGQHTEHFLHELYCFASTPYDLSGYDRNVQYTTDSAISTIVNEVLSSSDSEASIDSDIVMISSSEPADPPPGPSRASVPPCAPALSHVPVPPRAPPPPRALVPYRAPPPTRAPAPSRAPTTSREPAAFPPCAPCTLRLPPPPPPPPPAPRVPSASQAPSTSRDNYYPLQSARKPPPTTYFTPNGEPSSFDRSRNNVIPIETISQSDSDDDSSEVMVVGYIKPPQDRTPEVVDLLGSDSDVVIQENTPPDPPEGNEAENRPTSLVKLTLTRHNVQAHDSDSDGNDFLASIALPPYSPRYNSDGTGTTVDTIQTTPSHKATLSDSLYPSPSPPTTSDSCKSDSTFETCVATYPHRYSGRRRKLNSAEKMKRKAKRRQQRALMEKQKMERFLRENQNKQKSNSGIGVKSSKKSSEETAPPAEPERAEPPLDQPGPSGISTSRKRKQEKSTRPHKPSRQSKRLKSVVKVVSNQKKSEFGNKSKGGRDKARKGKERGPSASRAPESSDDSDSEDNLPLNLTLMKGSRSSKL